MPLCRVQTLDTQEKARGENNSIRLEAFFVLLSWPVSPSRGQATRMASWCKVAVDDIPMPDVLPFRHLFPSINEGYQVFSISTALHR